MRAKACPKKCMRGGRVTTNGYLNFLREFRKKCCGLSPVETVRRGAKAWCRLTRREKCRYRMMGQRSRPRCRKPKKRNPCKCMRAGPVTKNGYLNFLRRFRRKHCGLSPVQTVRQGAKAWNCLSEATKNRYAKMGCPRRSKPKCGSRRRRRSRSRCRSRRRSRPRCGSRRRRSRCGSRSRSRSRCSRRSMVCGR